MIHFKLNNLGLLHSLWSLTFPPHFQVPYLSPKPVFLFLAEVTDSGRFRSLYSQSDKQPIANMQ